MPGGRLTHEDRRRIAAGLADGLGYAEIARRLGRPTSTISREVNRNGGHDGYDADRSQKEAGERARRHRPGTTRAAMGEHVPGPGTTRASASTGVPDREAVREFEDRYVAMMIQTGFPRMMARVLVSLYTSDSGSLTVAELVQRLQVSPASISKAMRHLEHLQLVSRHLDPRRRRERYAIDEDVWYRSWTARTQSVALWAQTARQGAEVLGSATPAGVRLTRMSQFFDLVHQDMTEVAERWFQLVGPGQRAE